jgi:hypothetical protein
MGNYKAKQMDKLLKKHLRAKEYRVTYWDEGGDYASFTTIVSDKKEAREWAANVKQSLIQWNVLPCVCKTTIETTF